MHKLITSVAAICGIAFAGFADIVSVPLVSGENTIDYPARVIAVKAAGSTASGTIGIGEIIRVASVTTNSVAVTNIYPANATYQVADAFVGMTRVYSGTTDAAVWSNETAVVTNVSGSVTNVYRLTIGNLYDGDSLKYGPVTNQACSIRLRDVIATAPVTNVTTRFSFQWMQSSYTNELYSGTMANGKLNAATNIVILGGTITVSGTAFEGGNAYLVLER